MHSFLCIMWATREGQIKKGDIIFYQTYKNKVNFHDWEFFYKFSYLRPYSSVLYFGPKSLIEKFQNLSISHIAHVCGHLVLFGIKILQLILVIIMIMYNMDLYQRSN